MMANRSRWEDLKSKRCEPSAEARARIEQGLALEQLIDDLRIEAGVSLRELPSVWAPSNR